ncbi:hypothetical protein GW17_00008921, partial [Ensete ventricosum]
PLIGYLEMLARWAIAVAIAIAVLLLGRLPAGRCQGIGDRVNPPPTAPLLLQLQSTVDSLTRNIFPAVKDNFGFCIKDPCLVPWVHIAQLHNLMELQVFVIRKYEYQPPPGQPNHTCGGADIWADVDHSGDLFCPAGYYCPSTIQKNNCSSGYYSYPSHPTPSSFRLRPLVVNIHFCRMGSTYETSCYKSSTCNSNSENQSMTIFGALVMFIFGLQQLCLVNQLRQAKSREAAARIAREAVQARERWKAAKDIAVKHAVGIQNQISRTFSRKISNKLQERYKVLGLSRQLSDASTSDIEELSILGHVTAVMGPSGAGKTTFLTALAGKTSGCQMTGLIQYCGLLTIQLTVGVFPLFRLSADMSKVNRVLIVERTIESLGLQAVRNSLVGTVEKRGISGGQRKRVNVGLEMVMEPSLLILDEPTSGLDSSSSLLLLRALRREALEGVNISMVVHQPSYTLFSMFDDLILLAKGGLIAYQGSVKKVEEYFAGLGIIVPERVNPPDYFIDILEGIVKPGTSTAVKANQLPLIWMLHNGYNVPPDMRNEVDSVNASSRGGISSDRVGSDEDSGDADVWGGLKGAFEEKRDHLEHNFSKSKDLANRRTPGKLKQYKHYLGRYDDLFYFGCFTMSDASACRYSGVWLITRCGLLAKLHYDINHWAICIAVLFVYGFVFRCIAFICMVILNKK